MMSGVRIRFVHTASSIPYEASRLRSHVSNYRGLLGKARLGPDATEFP